LYSLDNLRAFARGSQAAGRGTRDSPVLIDLDDDHQSETSKLTNSTDTPQVVLSQEQNDILARVKAKKNVFFTGSAGKCITYEVHCSF